MLKNNSQLKPCLEYRVRIQTPKASRVLSGCVRIRCMVPGDRQWGLSPEIPQCYLYKDAICYPWSSRCWCSFFICLCRWSGRCSVQCNVVVSGNFREGNEFREIQKDGIVEGLHLWKRVTDVLLRCGGMWRMVCQTPESLMTHPVEPQ